MAGSISITVSTATYSIGENIIVNLSLQNNGDEAAEDVRVSLLLPDGFASDRVIVGQLVPGVPWSGSIGVNITGNIMPGTYPAVVLTEYKDLNGYPFSSVSKNTIIYNVL